MKSLGRRHTILSLHLLQSAASRWWLTTCAVSESRDTMRKWIIIIAVEATLGLALSFVAFISGYNTGFKDEQTVCIQWATQQRITCGLVSADRRLHETLNSSDSYSREHNISSAPRPTYKIRQGQLVWIRMDNGKTRHNGERTAFQSPRMDGGELRLSAWHSSGSHQSSQRSTGSSYGYRPRASKTTRAASGSKRGSGNSTRLPSGRDRSRSSKGTRTTPYHY